MAKKIQAVVKLQIAAGKATPAPPVGTALGPQGVNIMDFCKNFNARTAKDEGLIIPVVVTVSAKQVEDIAKLKMPDLNCDSLESAVKTIAGTARSMGLDVIG